MRSVVGCGVAVCLIGVTGMVAPTTVAVGGVMCGGVPATMVGTRHADHIQGTEGDDVIVALAGNDIVDDGGGNDLVCGNSGDDVVLPGSGDDLVWSGTGKDAVLLGAGNDVVRTGDDADWLEWQRGTPHQGAKEIWTGAGNDVAYVPIANPGGISLYAGGGDDEVFISGDPGTALNLAGGGGEDILWLNLLDTNGAVHVVIDLRTQRMRVKDSEGRGAFKQWEWPTMAGGDHHYTFHGTNGSDTFVVDNGSVEAYLYGGDDWIFGSGQGPHFVDGGAGRDDASLEEPLDCIAVETGTCNDHD